jgi:effector-binding domain-containing protein
MHVEIAVKEIHPRPTLVIRELIPAADMPRRMGEFFSELSAYMRENDIPMAEPPFALFHSVDKENVDMECGFPTQRPEEGEDNIFPSRLPGGTVVMAVHIGPYEQLEQTYSEIRGYMREHGLTPGPIMWEQYLTGPDVEDENKHVTHMFWPVEGGSCRS